MPSRTWIKIYCDKWLGGTIREETPLIRSVWVDLLTLAGSGRYGDTGIIQLAHNVGLTDEQLAAVLNIPINDWQTSKTKLSTTDRISTNGNNVITILNWRKYQSEYERQRSYKGNLQKEVTTKNTTKGYREKEKEKEKEKENIREGEEVAATPSFITYREKLKTTYQDLDIDEEWERCQIWFRDNKKTIKSPSLALGNWCKKEMEIRKSKEKPKSKGWG